MNINCRYDFDDIYYLIIRSQNFCFAAPGGEQQEDIPTLSARIEEKQKRVDSRKEMIANEGEI